MPGSSAPAKNAQDDSQEATTFSQAFSITGSTYEPHITEPSSHQEIQEDGGFKNPNVYHAASSELKTLQSIQLSANLAMQVLQASTTCDGEEGEELVQMALVQIKGMNKENQSISAILRWPKLLSTVEMMRLVAEADIPQNGRWRDHILQSDCLGQFTSIMNGLEKSIENRDQAIEEIVRGSGPSDADTMVQELRIAWRQMPTILDEFEFATQWGALLKPPYPYKDLASVDDIMDETEVHDIVEAIEKLDPSDGSYNSKEPIWSGNIDGKVDKEDPMWQGASQKAVIMDWYPKVFASAAMSRRGTITEDVESFEVK